MFAQNTDLPVFMLRETLYTFYCINLGDLRCKHILTDIFSQVLRATVLLKNLNMLFVIFVLPYGL